MRSSHCWVETGVEWHGRVADDDAVETVGMALREAEPGGAAHREAGEMRALDRQRIEQGDRVRQQGVEAVAAGRRFGLAMAALVVAQDAERAPQFPGLLVPHAHVGRERIAEHEPGRALGAVDLIVERDAVCLHLHEHCHIARVREARPTACNRLEMLA